MSRIKPRHAVAYHFFKEHDTIVRMLDSIRQTYDGPLSLAEDYMVWNVTRNKIRERMAIVDKDVWVPPRTEPPCPPRPTDRDEFAATIGIKTSDLLFMEETRKHRLDVDDAVKPIYERLGRKLGRKFNYPDPRVKD